MEKCRLNTAYPLTTTKAWLWTEERYYCSPSPLDRIMLPLTFMRCCGWNRGGGGEWKNLAYALPETYLIKIFYSCLNAR